MRHRLERNYVVENTAEAAQVASFFLRRLATFYCSADFCVSALFLTWSAERPSDVADVQRDRKSSYRTALTFVTKVVRHEFCQTGLFDQIWMMVEIISLVALFILDQACTKVRKQALLESASLIPGVMLIPSVSGDCPDPVSPISEDLAQAPCLHFLKSGIDAKKEKSRVVSRGAW